MVYSLWFIVYGFWLRVEGVAGVAVEGGQRTRNPKLQTRNSRLSVFPSFRLTAVGLCVGMMGYEFWRGFFFVGGIGGVSL
jgi:hypothetical protein